MSFFRFCGIVNQQYVLKVKLNNIVPLASKKNICQKLSNCLMIKHSSHVSIHISTHPFPVKGCWVLLFQPLHPLSWYLIHEKYYEVFSFLPCLFKALLLHLSFTEFCTWHCTLELFKLAFIGKFPLLFFLENFWFNRLWFSGLQT